MSGLGQVPTDVLQKYFEGIFTTIDSNGDGQAEAADVAPFMRRSGLPDAVLGQIWATVSQGQPRLSRNQFFYALGLIALAQNGKQPTMTELQQFRNFAPRFDGIPPPQVAAVPAPVAAPVSQPAPSPAASIGSSSASSVSAVEVTEQMKTHYRTMWTSLDTDNSGFVGGAPAREFFTKSGLPLPELGTIWQLADTNADGKLDFKEFCIAFFLIQWRLAKKDLPAKVPDSLLRSVGVGASSAANSSSSSSASSTATLHSVPGGSLLGAINAQALSSPTSPSSTLSSFSSSMVGTGSGVSTTKATSSSSNSAPTTTKINVPATLDLLTSFDDEPSVPSPAKLTRPTTHLDHHAATASMPELGRTGRNMRPVSLSAPLTLSHLQAAGIPGLDSESPRDGSSDPAWTISEEQKDIYKGYFQKAIAQDGSSQVTGATAKGLFSRSNLPNTTLAEIWMLSDTNKDGQLSLPEFTIAMHLINMALQGHSIPHTLPDSFLRAVGATAEPGAGSSIPTSSFGRTPGNSLTSPMQPGSFDSGVSVSQAAMLAQQQQQQQHEEEKRREVQRMRSTIAEALREKQALVQQLRQQQLQAIEVAKALLQQERNNSSAQENVKDLEVEVERLKIKGASVREKQAFAIQKLDAINEQKAQFDSLLHQKQQQYATEAAVVQGLQKQLDYNKTALQRQQADIERLRVELENVRKQKQMSQKVDPNALHTRLTEEKVKQQIRSPAAASPVRTGSTAPPAAADFGSRAFVDDFGTKASDPRPVAPSDFFGPDSDFGRLTASEHDSFGKFTDKSNNQFQSPSLNSSSSRAAASSVLDESSEGGAVADEFAPTPAEEDYFRSGSQTLPEPQEDFFNAGGNGGGGADGFGTFASDSRDSPFNKSQESLHANSGSDDFYSGKPAEEEDLPPPENDFALPAAVSPPTTSSGFMDSEVSVSSPNIPFRHKEPSTSNTNPFPMAASDDPFATSSGSSAGSSANPFGAPAASGGGSTAGDLFKPLPSDSSAEASGGGGGKLDDDDFFAPLSQAGKQEAEELEKASASRSSAFSAFDAPLFD